MLFALYTYIHICILHHDCNICRHWTSLWNDPCSQTICTNYIINHIQTLCNFICSTSVQMQQITFGEVGTEFSSDVESFSAKDFPSNSINHLFQSNTWLWAEDLDLEHLKCHLTQTGWKYEDTLGFILSYLSASTDFCRRTLWTHLTAPISSRPFSPFRWVLSSRPPRDEIPSPPSWPCHPRSCPERG